MVGKVGRDDRRVRWALDLTKMRDQQDEKATIVSGRQLLHPGRNRLHQEQRTPIPLGISSNPWGEGYVFSRSPLQEAPEPQREGFRAGNELHERACVLRMDRRTEIPRPTVFGDGNVLEDQPPLLACTGAEGEGISQDENPVFPPGFLRRKFIVPKTLGVGANRESPGEIGVFFDASIIRRVPPSEQRVMDIESFRWHAQAVSVRLVEAECPLAYPQSQQESERNDEQSRQLWHQTLDPSSAGSRRASGRRKHPKRNPWRAGKLGGPSQLPGPGCDRVFPPFPPRPGRYGSEQ